MIKNLDCDIYLYSNSIPDNINILDEFESLFKNHNKSFESAPPSKNGDFDNFRSCTVFSLKPNDSDSQDLINDKDKLNKRINDIMQTDILEFIKKTGFKPNYQDPWEIVRYTESQSIRWHCDSECDPCLISLFVYLNNDYSGGELEFRDFLPGKKIKPEPGSLLAFPSGLSYIHKVNPIESGVKYILRTFVK
jgi:hypothetical protein